jgi:hypothetical protein
MMQVPTTMFRLLPAITTLTLLGCHGSPPSGSPTAMSLSLVTQRTYRLVDTDQSETFNASRKVAPPTAGQAFHGQDAQVSGTQPSYTKSSDGLTVKDNITGLTWQQGYHTQPVSWTEATAIPAGMNVARYGGFSDWRLPTIKELYSLWNSRTGWPYIDTASFAFDPRTVPHTIVWSSNRYSGLLDERTLEGQRVGAVPMAFGVNFATGHIKAYSIDVGPKHFLRVVRGDMYGVNLFRNNGDGTVTDVAAGLMWDQADSRVGMNWEHALAFAEAKNAVNYLGHNDWRLPNTKELQSIVDYTRSPGATDSAHTGPAIDPIFSVSVITNEAGKADYPYFWTSTTVLPESGAPRSFGMHAAPAVQSVPGQEFRFAWYVAFGRAVDNTGHDLHGAGAVRFDDKSGGGPAKPDAERVNNFVRLVRNASAGSYPIVGTGQGATWNSAGMPIAPPGQGDAFYGQDAQHASAQPSYTDNRNGTISDLVTGLMWTQTPDLTGDGAINRDDKRTLTQAMAGASTVRVGGYDDWRLPTIKELYSLITFNGVDPRIEDTDASGVTPFIDTRHFSFAYGDTKHGERIIDAQFATSTTYVGRTAGPDMQTMFGVNFADGRIKGYGLGTAGGKTFYVLYVRGNSAYGINSFHDNADGTITDQAAGLMWSGTDSDIGMDWTHALAWAQQKNSENYLGHHDWRVPNAKELQSIVDYQRTPSVTSSPAIDPMFTATAMKNEAGEDDYGCYWSSTTHIGSVGPPGARAAYVCFGRAMGKMLGRWGDVHGAGAQRSDPKEGRASEFINGRGPQGDAIRINNYVRLVRDAK